MKIAVTGGKGGTGKSMVATSLAVEFARTNKTMLVDADVECPNDHLLLSVKRKEKKKVYQAIPKWDFTKCTQCGECAASCKQDAIVFVKGKNPAFVRDECIGCMACMAACPEGAISESKKDIGIIYTGRNHGVFLISGELKLMEHASGEVVAAVREFSRKRAEQDGAEVVVIDSAAGIGCPVIASIVGTDYVVMVTEPTPIALHDMKRALHLANHFGIKHGIVINKHNLDKGFCSQIEDFARKQEIPILAKIPYDMKFISSGNRMEPVVVSCPEYGKCFKQIIEKLWTQANHNEKRNGGIA